MSTNAIFASGFAFIIVILATVFLFKLGASLNPRKNNALINIFEFGTVNLFICALLPIVSLCFGNAVAAAVQVATLIGSAVLLASLLVWWKRTEPEMGLLAAMDKHLYGN
jgi:hypothetical protein